MIFLPLFISLTVGVAAQWYYTGRKITDKEDKQEHLAEGISAVVACLIISWLISEEAWLIVPFGILGGWYAKKGMEKLNRWL